MSILDTAKRVLDLADKADRTPLMVNRHDTVAGAIGWQLQQDGGLGEVVGEMFDLDIPKAKGTAHYLAAVHAAAPELAEWVRKVDEELRAYRDAHKSFKTPSSSAVYAAIEDLRRRLGLSESEHWLDCADCRARSKSGATPPRCEVHAASEVRRG
jgi:hypothetical protein